jgi:hypothetical protein
MSSTFVAAPSDVATRSFSIIARVFAACVQLIMSQSSDVPSYVALFFASSLPSSPITVISALVTPLREGLNCSARTSRSRWSAS